MWIFGLILAVGLVLSVLADNYFHRWDCRKCGSHKIYWRDGDLVCPSCDLV